VAMGSLCGASWFATLTAMCVSFGVPDGGHINHIVLFCFNVGETLWPKPCLVSL